MHRKGSKGLETLKKERQGGPENPKSKLRIGFRPVAARHGIEPKPPPRLSLLASPDTLPALLELRSDLRATLARSVAGQAPRRLVSDTTLKLRHEASEVLRREGEAYDLEVACGAGVVDVASSSGHRSDVDLIMI